MRHTYPTIAKAITDAGFKPLASNQLYRWENGHAPHAIERLVELCVVLETTPNDLLGFASADEAEAA